MFRDPPTPALYRRAREILHLIAVSPERELEMAEIHPIKRAYDQYAAAGKPQLEIVDGISFLSRGGEDVKDLLSNFYTCPSDVFLSSYPKTGTTWLMQIVKLIRNDGVEDGREVDQVIPMLELLTPEEAEVFKIKKLC